jgi:hypothetical protein
VITKAKTNVINFNFDVSPEAKGMSHSPIDSPQVTSVEFVIDFDSDIFPAAKGISHSPINSPQEVTSVELHLIQVHSASASQVIMSAGWLVGQVWQTPFP